VDRLGVVLVEVQTLATEAPSGRITLSTPSFPTYAAPYRAGTFPFHNGATIKIIR